MDTEQTIVLDGNIYTFQRESHSQGYPVYSGLLVCPVCCRIWAWLTMKDQPIHVKDQPIHEPRMVSCTRCNWHHKSFEFLHQVPGSLIDNERTGGIDWAMLDALPEELLRREFELTMKAWDTAPWH